MVLGVMVVGVVEVIGGAGGGAAATAGGNGGGDDYGNMGCRGLASRR